MVVMVKIYYSYYTMTGTVLQHCSNTNMPWCLSIQHTTYINILPKKNFFRSAFSLHEGV